jgi:polysaccharide biosynthesis transport protein
MITFSNPDPVLAARVANAHVKAFIEQTFKLHWQNNEVMQRFLESKLDELEKRLESSEAALNDYRRKLGVLAFTPEEDKDKMLSDRIGDLNRALVRAEEERIALQADVQTINSKDYDSLPSVVMSPLIQNLKIQMAELEGRYANIAQQATPNYPPVAQLHAQLLDIQSRLQQETRRVVGSINSRYQQALERENELRKNLDQEKAKAMSLKDASLRDAVLAREVETNRALYKSVLERIKMLGVSSEAQITNISVVDTAEVPLAPSSPRKKLSLVLGGFLGLLVGVGVAFVMEDSSNSLKTAEEVQTYLGIPTLATVLRLSGPNANRLPLGSRLLLEWSNGNKGPLATNGNGDVEPTPSLFAAASEAYRAVRTAILLSRSERPPKTILFSSALAGEGKSVTAVNTAIAFGHMLDRILLIDADLRRPRCHEILHQSQQPGLTEVLAGLQKLEDAIRPTGVKGLFFLSAGMIPPNPSELLGSKKMSEILAALAPDFDHILLDSAPILPVSDSVILSTSVEGVVLVSTASTPRQVTRDACMRLHHVGSKVLGVVLNNVDPQDQRYYYYASPA